MHLTGGQFKGRIIQTPKGEKNNIRPTLSKVRESVFNILASHFGEFSNLAFLDMFSGSGIMALEAYSRSFKNVSAIEFDQKAYAAAKKTFMSFNANINLIKGDALKITPKLEKFDVIYIDPPWEFDYEPIIKTAFKNITKEGVIIVEYDKKSTVGNAKKAKFQNEILPFKQKTYGRTNIDFYSL